MSFDGEDENLVGGGANDGEKVGGGEMVGLAGGKMT